MRTAQRQQLSTPDSAGPICNNFPNFIGQCGVAEPCRVSISKWSALPIKGSFMHLFLLSNI